ncbi:MAG: CPBP family intramembrane metalloprotease [Deltaproteobacteria bacterium]|nr:CPBP family intramembrane metalloprotease [Deltaproteobacteria bacterium]
MRRAQATANHGQSWGGLVFMMALAVLLFGLTFGWSWGNFWLKITISAVTLTVISFFLRPPAPGELRFKVSDVLWGLGIAVALWLLFWLGKTISTQLFSFAGEQIGGIYHKSQGTPLWLIALILFFLTGPSEELFWRRYLQSSLMERLGAGWGWLVATALYAGVHLASANFMLIGAAAVAGAYWGLLYWKLGRIPPIIISHSIWSSVIFAIVPIP